MLRFIRKRVRPKASDHGDDVEVYSKRVRSKASDHKDDVEVYSKRRKQKLYQKSERIISECREYETLQERNEISKGFLNKQNKDACS
ncbi:uncharacterized protein LOC120334057 isoform X6 [Styela clava]